MTPLRLTPEYMVHPPKRSRASRENAWHFDAMLDGLLSGSIGGSPMDPQDARLLIMLLEGLGWSPDAHQLAGAIPYLTRQLDATTLRTLMRNLGYSCRTHKIRGRDIPLDRVIGFVVGPDQRLWKTEISETGRLSRTRPAPAGHAPDRRHMIGERYYNFVGFAPLSLTSDDASPSTQESYSAATLFRFAGDLQLALLLTLLSGVLTVAFSIIVIYLFDLIVTGQQPNVIAAILSAAMALFVFDLSFRSLKARLLGRISGRFEFLLGSALFAKLLKLPRRMIDQAPISEQSVRLRELEGIRDLFAGPFAAVALELPVTLLLIAAISLFSPQLAMVLIAMTVVFIALGYSFVPRLIRFAQRMSLANSRLTQMKMELIEKRDVISRNGIAGPWMQKSERAINDVVKARFELSRAGSLLEALSYLFLPLAAVTVIFLGAQKVIAGDLSGGQLVAITMLTWRAVAPIQQGLLILPKTRDLLRIFRQVDAMMRFAEEDQVRSTVGHSEGPAVLAASNVFLRGPHAHLPILAGVSLEIPAGLFVTVTGASGAGKSALLGVLSGNTQPQAGSVRLGDMGLSELSGDVLGRRVLQITSQPLMIYGSLAQNMRFVDPLLSDAQIETALNEVGLAQTLAHLPEGMHTRLDPAVDSTLLLGGVRTAVAVAQALLIKPAVLLLDEASEDVDPAIHDAIIAAIERRRGEMTSLVATHRPSVIRASDAVIQIAEGRTRLTFNNDTKDLAV